MRSDLRRRKRNLAFAVLAMLFSVSFSLAQESTPFTINDSPLPAPTGFVNDYAGVIDPETKSRLENRLKEFKAKTNPPVELAVAVVRTTGGRDIFEYSTAVARGWKIGSDADDNPGALLFIAIDDRKYFTQVSRDLEDELPDGVVGSLQRQYLVPEFKNRNYSKGISDTIEAYISTIESRGSGATPTPGTGRQRPSSSAGGTSIFSLFCCGLIIFVIILIIVSRSNRGGPGKGDSDRWGGGSGGGGVANSALPWVIGSILSGSGSSSGSSSSDWGGSSDGGFGGFGGGGDFGGGGAGGDW